MWFNDRYDELQKGTCRLGHDVSRSSGTLRLPVEEDGMVFALGSTTFEWWLMQRW